MANTTQGKKTGHFDFEDMFAIPLACLIVETESERKATSTKICSIAIRSKSVQWKSI